MLFTTSWDDGYALDQQVDILLGGARCTGTFYVCPQAQHGVPMLREDGIRDLGDRCEIGAHTLTHPRLTRLDPARAREEIRGSKAWVEGVTGKPCRMFCYPYGDVNTTVRALVAEGGFLSARTTERLRFDASDPFTLPITLQVSPFPWRRRFRPPWKILDPLGPLRAQWARLATIGVPLRARGNWLALAEALFEIALANSRQSPTHFFHLYGHSREIERYGMWEELEEFLRFVARQPGVQHVTNGELAAHLVGDARHHAG